MPSPAKSPSRKSASPARKQSPVAKKPGRRRSIDPEKIIRPNRVNARPWADLEDEALVVLVAELGPAWSMLLSCLNAVGRCDQAALRGDSVRRAPPASLLARLTHTSVPLWCTALRANTFTGALHLHMVRLACSSHTRIPNKAPAAEDVPIRVGDLRRPERFDVHVGRGKPRRDSTGMRLTAWRVHIHDSPQHRVRGALPLCSVLGCRWLCSPSALQWRCFPSGARGLR